MTDWIDFPTWYPHDGGPAPCPPDMIVDVFHHDVHLRRVASKVKWYETHYWRPADRRYECRFNGDRLIAYRIVKQEAFAENDETQKF